MSDVTEEEKDFLKICLGEMSDAYAMKSVKAEFAGTVDFICQQ
jgi:hypothetical protein